MIPGISVVVLAVLCIALFNDALSRRLFLLILRYKVHEIRHQTVLPLKNGWLFHKEQYDYCFCTFPPNHRAIIDYSSLLASRGISLIVVPVPDKIEVYPEKICGFSVQNVNPQRPNLLKKLSDAGVDVIDLLPVFLQAKRCNELFPPDETHWTQAAIDIAAPLIGERIKQIVPLSERLPVHNYYRKPITIPDEIGDLTAVSNLPDSLKKGHPYYCAATMVSDTEIYRDTVESQVLIIGDSFAMYKQAHGAHIGAAIAYHLKYPVSVLARIGGHAQGTQMLKNQKVSFVQQRKVVVWIFTSRGFAYSFVLPKLPAGM